MDPVVKKETAYIAAGTAAISALVQIVWAVFFEYDISVFLGALWGGVFAVWNFFMLGVTVNKASHDGDQTLAKRRIHASYSLRLALTALMVVVAVILPRINWIMAVMSLFFPRLTILVEPLFRKELRKKGGNE